jgi:hypothetical protein
MLIGGEIFDSLEPTGGSGGEAVEKPDLLKDEAEIGGEFRHGWLLVCGRKGGRLL